MNFQKTVLCYGDSNTWGYIPANRKSESLMRYNREARWTGILQTILGENYYIVEEGLNSRTTNLDYKYYPDRNGKNYLPSCLYSHSPIDLVIIALGGNDLKTCFNRTPIDIKNGLRELINIIHTSNYGAGLKNPPKVLIIPPVIPLVIAEKYTDENDNYIFIEPIKKATLLNKLYLELAAEEQCYFLVLEDIYPSEIDGLHLDATMHKKLAVLLKAKIQEILQ